MDGEHIHKFLDPKKQGKKSLLSQMTKKFKVGFF